MVVIPFFETNAGRELIRLMFGWSQFGWYQFGWCLVDLILVDVSFVNISLLISLPLIFMTIYANLSWPSTRTRPGLWLRWRKPWSSGTEGFSWSPVYYAWSWVDIGLILGGSWVDLGLIFSLWGVILVWWSWVILVIFRVFSLQLLTDSNRL